MNKLLSGIAGCGQVVIELEPYRPVLLGDNHRPQVVIGIPVHSVQVLVVITPQSCGGGCQVGMKHLVIVLQPDFVIVGIVGNPRRRGGKRSGNRDELVEVVRVCTSQARQRVDKLLQRFGIGVVSNAEIVGLPAGAHGAGRTDGHRLLRTIHAELLLDLGSRDLCLGSRPICGCGTARRVTGRGRLPLGSCHTPHFVIALLVCRVRYVGRRRGGCLCWRCDYEHRSSEECNYP